jgi:hypothetical protein
VLDKAPSDLSPTSAAGRSMSFERKPKRLVIFIKNAGGKQERRYRGSLGGRSHWFESRLWIFGCDFDSDELLEIEPFILSILAWIDGVRLNYCFAHNDILSCRRRGVELPRNPC